MRLIVSGEGLPRNTGFDSFVSFRSLVYEGEVHFFCVECSDWRKENKAVLFLKCSNLQQPHHMGNQRETSLPCDEGSSVKHAT